MTLAELLNADVRSIGRWIRLGLAWWMHELSEMVPPSLRRRSGRAPRWAAVMSEEGTVRLWCEGAPAGGPERASGPVRRADLILPASGALVRDLELPRLSGADLRRLVALNIDRYTPFSAEQVYFDAAVVDRTAEGSRQRVRLGVILRDQGRALLAQATELGLKVERMGPPGGADGRTLELDFLRAMRETEGGDPMGRRRTYLWLACALLAAANVGVAVLRDMQDVGQLQRLVDDQAPTASLALRLRKTVETERARRIALLTRRSVHEPLRILDATTRALPAGEWVQRLEWNGRVLRLVGFKQPGFDVLSALRGPALTNPRSLLSDMPTRTASGQEPFDVLADAVTRTAR